MTKYEFLGDLSRLLSDLPDEERRQAMKYYEDYFADAGESREQDVLNELGSPDDIAGKIKSDLSENIEYGEGSSAHVHDFVQPYQSFGQNAQNNQSRGNGQEQNQGTQNHQQNEHTQNGQSGWQSGQTQNTDSSWKNGQTQNTNTEWQNGQAQSKPGSDPAKTALIVILIIITSPVWGSILAGILSLIVGIIAAILGIFSALILGGGGMAIGGFACVFGGIIAGITGEISSGLLTIGIGCVLFSVGSVCCYLGIMLCIKLIPAIWRECVKGFDWGKGKLNQSFHA